MSEMTRRRAETEGRRGSRIDTDEGGRYVGIPLNGHSPRPINCQSPVQEIGGGTLLLERGARDPWTSTTRRADAQGTPSWIGRPGAWTTTTRRAGARGTGASTRRPGARSGSGSMGDGKARPWSP